MLSSASSPAAGGRRKPRRSTTCRSVQGGLEDYLGAGQGQRDRARRLGLLGQFGEARGVEARHVSDGGDGDPGDPEALLLLLQADARGGAQILGGEPASSSRLASDMVKQPASAAAMSSSGLVPPTLLDAVAQRELPLERAAAERDPTSPIGHGSLPAGLRVAAYTNAQGLRHPLDLILYGDQTITVSTV